MLLSVAIYTSQHRKRAWRWGGGVGVKGGCDGGRDREDKTGRVSK